MRNEPGVDGDIDPWNRDRTVRTRLDLYDRRDVGQKAAVDRDAAALSCAQWLAPSRLLRRRAPRRREIGRIDGIVLERRIVVRRFASHTGVRHVDDVIGSEQVEDECFGSRCAACANSSMNDAIAKPWGMLMTERSHPMRVCAVAGPASPRRFAIAYGKSVTPIPSSPRPDTTRSARNVELIAGSADQWSQATTLPFALTSASRRSTATAWIVVVLQVVFAGPQHFDGCTDGAGEKRGLDNEIVHRFATERASQQRHV